MIYRGTTASFLKDDDEDSPNKWFRQKTTHDCAAEGCIGKLVVVYQKSRPGVEAKLFLVCDSGVESHRFLNKTARFHGTCRCCKLPIHKGQIIAKHRTVGHLWVHTACKEKPFMPNCITCYLCMKVCTAEENITKIVNGSKRMYRHTESCMIHPDNPDVIDLEAEVSEEVDRNDHGIEIVATQSFLACDIRNTDAMPLNRTPEKVKQRNDTEEESSYEDSSFEDSPPAEGYFDDEVKDTRQYPKRRKLKL